MKIIAILIIITTTFFFVGCEFKSPLTKEHNIPINPLVLGLWELTPEKDTGSKKNLQMMILKYSDTEYLIHYPTGKDGLYFRGYPIKIGNVSCVQIKCIGTGKGLFEKNEKKLYHVASYELIDNNLKVKMLNHKLIDGDLVDGEALNKAFLKHQDNQELFIDPGNFKRIKN